MEVLSRVRKIARVAQLLRGLTTICLRLKSVQQKTCLFRDVFIDFNAGTIPFPDAA